MTLYSMQSKWRSNNPNKWNLDIFQCEWETYKQYKWKNLLKFNNSATETYHQAPTKAKYSSNWFIGCDIHWI